MEKKQILIIAGEKGTQIYNLKTLKIKKDFKEIACNVDDGIANIDDDKIIIIWELVILPNPNLHFKLIIILINCLINYLIN